MGGFADELGISGKQGEYYQPQFSNPALTTLLNRNDIYTPKNAGNLDAAIQKFKNGSTSEDALSAMSGDSEQKQAMRDALATGSNTGSLFATNEVQSNPILSQLFGKGGALDRTTAEEKDLSSRGFQLQPQDVEAYGQASGNIARLFGQQEQDLSQSLANRGLASAPSGAAGLGFSGLQGNKNEQLAKAQMDIANQRMQNNLARLTNTRQFMSQLGDQGANAIQQQYGRQLSGAQETRAGLENTANLQNQSNAAQANAQMASSQDKRAAKSPSLGEAFGSGLLSSAGQIGASPGTGATSFSKSFGSSLGSMSGGGMGG